jgi:diguanylate cyclase (GGDEF)-like protein
MEADRSRSGFARKHPAKALAFLARLATEFTAALDVTALVSEVLPMLRDEVGFDSCTVGLVNASHDTIRLVGAAGIRAAFKGLEIPRGHGLNWIVVESGHPLYVPDLQDDARVYRQQPGVRSGIYAPLTVRDRTIGVLSAHGSAVDAFTPEDLNMLTVVARYLAGAFEVARLHEELRELAATDPLTRLPNRRCMMERIQAELSRARRHGETVSIALVDFDDFKHVNDTRGHLVGDAVMVAVARTLKRGMRAHDVPGRWGGDEFLLLFPHTGRDDAQAVFDRLRQIEVTVTGDQVPIVVMLSYGLATWPQDGADVDALMAAADRRLYAMKQSPVTGRHRTGGSALQSALASPESQ